MFLSAGLLPVSCSEASGPGGGTGPEGGEIGFRSVVEKTRAVETDQTNIADFRVSALWVRDAAASDYEPAFMDGVRVVRQPDAAWTYSPVRYWPPVGTVDFFGHSPANSSGVEGFEVAGPDYDRISVEYNVTTDPLRQEDFMVASALGRTASPVVMDFRHALSQIEFRVRCSAIGVTFRVRQIELCNLDRAGLLTGAATAPGAAEMDWTWSRNTAPEEKSATYGVHLPQPVAVSYPASASGVPDYVSLTDPSVGNLMILPQQVSIGTGELYTQADIDADENDQITQGLLDRPKDLNDKFYIAVRLDSETVYYPGTGIIPFHDNVTIYIPLYVSLGDDGVVGGGDDEPFEFVAGSKYTFMLELNDLDQMVFTIGETEWTRFITIPVSGS